MRDTDEQINEAAERFEKFADHIEALVDDWPELTDEQKSRLAVLLRPT